MEKAAVPGPVPIYGIEAGRGIVRATRAVRQPDGRVAILSHEERRSEAPLAECLAEFVRRRGLRRHPLMIALLTPAPHFLTVTLTPEEMLQSADELRESFLERVHPEPDQVELRYSRAASNVWLLCAEERAQIESVLVALEKVQATTYGVLSSTDAALTAIRHFAGLTGDALVVRILPDWTEILFLDGPNVRRHSLPAGARELADAEARRVFGQDLRRLTDYHRTRVPREGPERVVLLGADPDLAAALGPLLPSPPEPLPEPARLAPGRGLKPGRLEALLAQTPGSLGAAAAAAAVPRKGEMSFKALPDVLALPRPPARTWFAAAAILWLALAVAFLGGRQRRPVSPAAPPVTKAAVESLSSAVRQARRAVAFPAATQALLDALPPAEAAPFATERAEILVGPGGDAVAELALLLPGLDPADAGSPRRAALEALAEEHLLVLEILPAEGGARAVLRREIGGNR